jgi:hypothetical protein
MVEKLEVGKFYHVDWSEKKQRKTLMLITNITESQIEFRILASENTPPFNPDITTYFTPDTFNQIKADKKIREVMEVKDLPLYLGWPYTSPELSEMIKQGRLHGHYSKVA